MPAIDTKQILDQVDLLTPDLVRFIQESVRIPSLPGHEQEFQGFLSGRLLELGMKVTVSRVRRESLADHPAFCDDDIPYDQRLNVIGRWPGRGGGRSLILNGHADVVSPGAEELWGDSPWSGKLSDGRIYGRGSTDMKGGLAAAVYAMESLRQLGFTPDGDVIFQSVVGEESGGCGTLAAILDGCRADAAIIMEPTGLQLAHVQSGALTFRLTVTGRAVHACMRNQGVNAIEKFYLLLRALNDFDTRRHERHHHPVYPDTGQVAPISVGKVSAGDWPSTVPDRLVAEGRFGVFPDEGIAEAKSAFHDRIRETAEADDWLAAHPPVLEWVEGQFEPGVTAPDEDILKVLGRSHREVLGGEARLTGVTYGSDLRLFTNYAGMPAVLYGPGDVLDAHVVNESVAVGEVVDATKILALTIVEWCGGETG
jgi:acetylornithine deacetylase